MPLHLYRIQVKGNFTEKGFGFSCMRMAFQNKITGTLLYESAHSAILEISGEEKDIISVLEQCKKEDYITEVHIINKTKTAHKLTDFIMLNQID
jgi:hypothetical protein